MVPKTENQLDLETCGIRLIHLDRVKQARQQDLPDPKVMAMAHIFKAMGDPTRLRILSALGGGEMCVCDLAAFTGVSESAMSHQLRRLKDLGLVRPRREGQVLFYSLDDDHVAALLSVCQEHVEHRG
jgi:DNA-binding transcriptional ArsR family regulator